MPHPGWLSDGHDIHHPAPDIPVAGLVVVCLAMGFGSFGGGYMGTWGWAVSFTTLMILVPIAVILCLVSGTASLVKIVDEDRGARKSIGITGNDDHPSVREAAQKALGRMRESSP